MKLKKLTPKKNAAQAIVEFAIVLPLLLLLLYGLLEAGRLLFVYSSVVTASRQASRYGSATGQGSDFSADGGPNNTGSPRYQDCEGIKWSAQRADFLDAFDDSDIKIEYDDGEGVTAPFVTGTIDKWCTGSTDNTVVPSNNNTTRVKVTVTGHFSSLVPKIVPFFNRTIEATSSRTILMSISIPAVGAGGGGTAPGVTVTTSPNPSQVNEPVTVSATVTDLSGGTPTGTVSFTVDGSALCTATLAGGTASCPGVVFPAINTTPGYAIKATYNPATTAYITSTGETTHFVGPSVTITKITQDTPDPSLPNTSVTIYVTVENQYPGGNTPTGTVVVNTAAGTCNITLNSGGGYCPVTFTALGTSNITATYTPTDTAKHYPSSDNIESHTVQTTLPPPTDIPTAVPPPTVAPPPTAAPTAVSGCESIRNGVGAIVLPRDETMYLSIPNTNNYPVTIGNVFVAWNYSAGHSPGNSSLTLKKAQLNSNVFWTGSIKEPEAYLTPSTTVTIPANSTARITFTFDKTYNETAGGVEKIHLYFSTPGCESFPVVVPVGAPTVTPSAPTLVPGTCGPVNETITAPFTKEGVGTFCWKTDNLGTYFNSWNLDSVTINGVTYTNVYVNSTTYPAKIDGFWYISYKSSVAWGHFEIK